MGQTIRTTLGDDRQVHWMKHPRGWRNLYHPRGWLKTIVLVYPVSTWWVYCCRSYCQPHGEYICPPHGVKSLYVHPMDPGNGSRPASGCGTETWPDLRLKATPSRPPSTLSHSTWLHFTWQWHVTWVDFKRLHKRHNEWFEMQAIPIIVNSARLIVGQSGWKMVFRTVIKYWKLLQLLIPAKQSPIIDQIRASIWFVMQRTVIFPHKRFLCSICVINYIYNQFANYNLFSTRHCRRRYIFIDRSTSRHRHFTQNINMEITSFTRTSANN